MCDFNGRFIYALHLAIFFLNKDLYIYGVILYV